ncbi:hypothetical protein HHI36_017919 [Cryptolaemus montrouzieri]|uniref:Heparan-alpha-glucosaminide N-acetyltransferase catalytic domain-containing protein n=1 Tax=Cryptolaemus montrouzieri TaxID=559131 RepID=A0ABD2NYN6_9CUCU
MDEFGVYNITFDDTNCKFETLKNPVNIYLPILTVFFIYLGLICLFISGRKFKSKIWKEKNVNISENNTERSTNFKRRIKSLDTFRGISIVTMIFVNLGAGGYDILDHEPWNGLHLADFVFPCFLWIMGVCIPISLESGFKKGATHESMVKMVTVRSVKLFCLGIFLNSGIYFYNFRLMGVLQRFSISYFL